MELEAIELPPTGVPMIDIRKLWTVFTTAEKRFVVHQDLDLAVQRGEILSIVGGSGTGKTVLLRQILGLETPTRGEIEVMGQSVADLGRKGAASRIGILFQHGALFYALTPHENLAFLGRPSTRRSRDL